MNTTDIRSKIHQIVSLIEPLDSIEKEHIDFTLNWIQSGSGLFRIEKPATPDIHLVSYFVIASPDMHQILLVDHKKAERWIPPGGHVEPDEDPQETVKREAQEELGIEVDFFSNAPLFLTVTKTVGSIVRHTDVSLWYLLKCDPDQSLDYDFEEFNQIRWFMLNEIPFEKSDPHMKRFLQKMRRHQSATISSEHL